MAKSRRKPKPFIEAFRRLNREILRKLNLLLESLKDWTVRRLGRIARDSDRATAGFILPTAVMVILVVTLLVSAIVIRSTDRAKNASNYRVNQVTLNASLPAIERAKAKINEAFQDPTLPVGTPSDESLAGVFEKPNFTLPDEVLLRVAFDLDKAGGINDKTDIPLTQQETIKTAWRYPVDTDNDGRFDSFTLYGVFFRSPSLNTNGGFARERTPLDARTPPQTDNASSGACAAALGTSASLVGTEGWYKVGANLKKSFFVYTATVPITSLNPADLSLSTSPAVPDRYKNINNYEVYTGNRGFTALEYQQDRSRIPLGNNAVVYEDDLDIYAGAGLAINGRVVTNSNLMAASANNAASKTNVPSNTTIIFQVSSEDSCFYEQENSKIIVGGNVGQREIGGTTGDREPVGIHLFNGSGNNVVIDKVSQKSVGNSADEIAYNTLAYEQRIQVLVESAEQANSFSVSGAYPNFIVGGNDPQDIRDRVEKKINADQNPDPPDGKKARREALEAWFRNRTRRVPYLEVGFGKPAIGTYNASSNRPLQGAGTDKLRPIDAWIYPTDANTKLSLSTDKPDATNPDNLKDLNKEIRVGDRLLVGNNLPARWYDTSTNEFADKDTKQPVTPSRQWSDGTGERYRLTRVQELVDVGLTERDGFWEKKAAELPKNPLDNLGGLRVITGAGVYLPATSDTATGLPNISGGTLANFYNASPVVWPDWMPFTPALKTAATTAKDTAGKERPFLQMRATAVYHYAYEQGKKPLACVSSFYDPTNLITARNPNTLADISGALAANLTTPPTPQPAATDGANSNNGIVYTFQGTHGAGLGSIDDKVKYQAELKYPNGRLVNPMLKKAVNTPQASRSLAENAAIDSTLCALQILNNPTNNRSQTPASGFSLPDGTIQEVTFLDGREVKANNAQYTSQSTTAPYHPASSSTSPLYDLPVEERQPLEIRATAINLDRLRKADAAEYSSGIFKGPLTEWMLPDSGIVYASRDDALPDASEKSPAPPTTTPTIKDYEHELGIFPASPDKISATDFWLDPTRRPNAIVLYNGRRLSRGNTYNAQDFEAEEEKGLILATNLPVYVKGEFNPHDNQEFNQALAGDWGNFYKAGGNRKDPFNNLNKNFACRPGDSRLPDCTTGDGWRAATVLGDAMTLLSDDFRFGFRNEGDYDLRNNQTDNLFRDTTSPVETAKLVRDKRSFNGFFDNSFVTNGLSSDNANAFGAGNNFKDNQYSTAPATRPLFSSYFNNNVTPIQRRRESDFSEYAMEICRKLPVSECLPNDWVIGGYDVNGDKKLDNTAQIDEADVIGTGPFDLNNNGNTTDKLPEDTPIPTWVLLRVANKVEMDKLGSGTTARAAIKAQDQLYPRRVAFARNQYNQLELKEAWTATSAGENSGKRVTPAALGRDNNDKLAKFDYANTGNPATDGQPGKVPKNRDNALWFRTTNNQDGLPYATGSFNDYQVDKWLYYEPPKDEKEEFLLPDVLPWLDQALPNVSPFSELKNIAKAMNGDFPNTTIDSNDSSDLAICITGTNRSGGLLPDTGDGGLAQKYFISKKYDKTLIPVANNDITLNSSCSSEITTAQNELKKLTKIGDITNPATLPATLQLPAATPVPSTPNLYVYDLPATLNSGLTLELKGNSETIFVFRATGTNGIQFGGSTVGVKLILNGVSPNNIYWVSNGNVVFDSVGSGRHSLAGNFLGTGALQMNAQTDIIGGRFLGFKGSAAPNENFIEDGAKIFAITNQSEPLLVPVLQTHVPKGTFRPTEQSAIDSDIYGSYWLPESSRNGNTFNLVMAVGDSPARPGEQNGGLGNFSRFLERWNEGGGRFFNTTINGSFIQLKRSTYATGTFSPLGSVASTSNGNNPGGPFNYPQSYRTGSKRYSFYEPAKRVWGFDVGLLSQIPDRFFQQFTLPPAGEPNEYYREVSRDDDWVKTLLCAVSANDTSKDATNKSERPVGFCKDNSQQGTH